MSKEHKISYKYIFGWCKHAVFVDSFFGQSMKVLRQQPFDLPWDGLPRNISILCMIIDFDITNCENKYFRLDIQLADPPLLSLKEFNQIHFIAVLSVVEIQFRITNSINLLKLNEMKKSNNFLLLSAKYLEKLNRMVIFFACTSERNVIDFLLIFLLLISASKKKRKTMSWDDYHNAASFCWCFSFWIHKTQ